MEDKNTYYTPTIEEFCVGFMYEYTYVSSGIPLVWKERTITDSNITLNQLHYISEQIADDHIRVRHLCHEDIVAEGWELDGEGQIFPFRPKYQLKDDEEMKLEFASAEPYHSDPNVCIYELDKGKPCFVDQGYTGRVLNRSELRRVMKMVGIEK